MNTTCAGKMRSMYALGERTRWVTALRSITVGSCVFFLGSLSHIWLRHQSASLSIAFVDGALVGVGAGILVLFYERRQRLSIMRKREVIRMMNHHVRNSLQVISLAVSVPQREEDVNKVRMPWIKSIGRFGKYYLATEKTSAICLSIDRRNR